MTPTEEKLKQLQAQIEFLAQDEDKLRRQPGNPRWSAVKAEQLKAVRENLIEYRRTLSMQGVATVD